MAVGNITAFNRLSQAILGTNQQIRQSSKALDSLFTTFKNTVRYGISSSVFNNMANSIQKAYAYRKQLDRLDFDEILNRFQKLGEQIQQTEGFEEEPIFVLIFHEKYDNPCSERWPVQDWFRDHGYDIKEFNI